MKKTQQSSHHIHLLIQLEGPTNKFLNFGFYLRKRPAGTQQKLGYQKSCPVLYASENISSISTAFCLPQLSVSPYICFLKKATSQSDDNACFFLFFLEKTLFES